MAVTFERDKIYREYEVRELGFTEAELRRARKSGALQTKEVGRGRRTYLGAWLLDWLSKGEREK